MCILQIHCMSCSSVSPPNSKQKPSLQGPFYSLCCIFLVHPLRESPFSHLSFLQESPHYPVQPPQFDFFLQAWSLKIKTPMFQHSSDLLRAVTYLQSLLTSRNLCFSSFLSIYLTFFCQLNNI